MSVTVESLIQLRTTVAGSNTKKLRYLIAFNSQLIISPLPGGLNPRNAKVQVYDSDDIPIVTAHQ